MKQCFDCKAQVDDRANTCPNCGGGTFATACSAEDALSMLDSLKARESAKEHVDRGGQLILEGRYDEGIAECKKAIEQNPHNAVAHSNIGGALVRQGKTEEAIPWLEKALEINPTLDHIAEVLAEARGNKSNGSMCFVATACYGDAHCHEVMVLRAFRDEQLMTSSWGRLLVRIYYACSPALANCLTKHPALRSGVRRLLLDPLASRVKNSSEEQLSDSVE